MRKTLLRLIIPALLAGCSSPPVDKVTFDAATDTRQPDQGFLDTNNGLTPDLIAEGCQVLGCPETQVCNMQTGGCVDCLTNAECGANGTCDPASNKCSCDDGYHLCAGACAANDAVSSCGSSCDPCPTDANGTATCDGSQCGIECNDPLILDPGTNACVGCTDNTDCAGSSASVCDAGSCVSCASAADCSHIAGAPICDAGTCVECSTADDSPCGGNSCDPFTGTCTTTPKRSVAQCAPCVADSECDVGFGCVPMFFQGDVRSGGFCLPADNNGCIKPMPITVSRTTLSGVTGDYCSVNEDLTTCEALGDYFAPCGDNSDCGAAGLDDGICEAVDFEFAKCTFLCDTSDECPTESLIGCATGNVGMKWCGAF